MPTTPQPGITPPTPGQHKEEPDFWNEEDIPSQDKPAADDGAEEPGTERRGDDR